MEKIQFKTITKYRHDCNDCKNTLTEAERAFNETLCNTCQEKRNAAVYALLAPLIAKLKKL